jgi:hypothetical protein
VPVETIKCQECGSADVTEFKPGSYVCAHCEAIFKHVDPVAASGGCEIDGCGVPAIGRCSSCKRRFCGTHQARDMGPERPVIRASGRKVAHRDTEAIYVDQCAPCRAEQLAREAREKVAAKNGADSKHQAMLASEDPAMIAAAVAAMTGDLDRRVVAKAWEDYVRLASAPPFELVTLTPATRRTNPSETGREPLWRCTCVTLHRVDAWGKDTSVIKTSYLDRGGNVMEIIGGRARPVGQACVVPAGAALRFNRYARGRDTTYNAWPDGKGTWQVEAEGAWYASRDRTPAKFSLLVAAICQLAGLTPPEWAKRC